MEPSQQAPPGYNQAGPPGQPYQGGQAVPQGQPYPGGQPVPQGQPYQGGQTVPQGQPYQGQPGQPAAAYPTGGYQSGQPGYQQPPPTVVVAQPVASTTIVSSRPPDYMIPSILVCIFCFWPTGLAAIYYSIRTNTMVTEGNMPEAQRYSRTAKYLLITTIIVGTILMIIIIAAKVATASATATYSY